MAQLSAEVKQWVNKETPGLGPAFEPFQVDLVLSEGHRIDMGTGLTAEVLKTPGTPGTL